MNRWLKRAIVSVAVPFAVRKFQERQAGKRTAAPATPRSRSRV